MSVNSNSGAGVHPNLFRPLGVLLSALVMSSVALADGVTLGLPARVDGVVTLKAKDVDGDPSVFERAEALQIFVGSSADCCEGRPYLPT